MVQLSELLGNKALIKLLEFFIENPSDETSYTEIKKRVKIAKATLTKWLNFMIKNDFISSKIIGRNKLYKLNREKVLIKQLKILNIITKLLPLRRIIEKTNCEIFIYGSASRGEDTEKSDIDVFILGNVKPREVSEEIRKMEKKLNKEIKVQIFTNTEWANMERKDRAFYERVEKDKIKIE